MTRFTNGERRVHVGYSTNVHRSESISDVRRFLDDVTTSLRELLRLRRLGIDLRIGRDLAEELIRNPEALAGLREYLDASGLYVMGVNAFPLGDFQAHHVKTAVYRPSWDDPARRETTERIARVTAALIPHDVHAAISTVAGGYRPLGDTDEVRERMAEHFIDAALFLRRLAAETGRHLSLTPEPEPDTTMDDLASTLRFFRESLRPTAARRGAEAETALRDHISINLDACHLSVAFESPAATIRALEDAGITVGKCNISSCVSVLEPATNRAGREFLAGMDEPRFLHQTWGRSADGRITLRLPDLASFAALTPRDLEAVAEVRSHFHVPLYHPGALHPPGSDEAGHLGAGTTQNETASFVRAILGETSCDTLAVETYTWHVFGDTPLDPTRGSADPRGTDVAGSAADETLTAGLAAELRWTFEQLEACGWRSEDTQ